MEAPGRSERSGPTRGHSPRAGPGRAAGPSPGFTLIELLVVIAIISMLAAILFPVFSRARASAREAKCLSNLRQLGLAFTMYADDYDDALPRTTYGSAGGMYSNRYGRGDLPFTWYDEVLPYTRNEDIHNCPEQRCLPPGYRLNDRCSGAPVGAVSDPSSKILVVDGSDIAGSFNYTLRDPSLTNISLRHNGGLNCLYLDGHAKWATFDHIQDVPTYWDPYAEP